MPLNPQKEEKEGVLGREAYSLKKKREGILY
jgi:hypothetical protein